MSSRLSTAGRCTKRLIYTEERNLFPFFGRAAAGREAASSLYGGVCILVILENGI
jgi:hypothetical protein